MTSCLNLVVLQKTRISVLYICSKLPFYMTSKTKCSVSYMLHSTSIAYRRTSQRVATTAYRYRSVCCSGYSGSPPNCRGKCIRKCSSVYILYFILLAICSPSCANGGTCSRPNSCSCSRGWTGRYCTSRECFNANYIGVFNKCYSNLYYSLCKWRNLLGTQYMQMLKWLDWPVLYYS